MKDEVKAEGRGPRFHPSPCSLHPFIALPLQLWKYALNLKQADFPYLRALSRPAFDVERLYLPRPDLRAVPDAERRALEGELGRATRALLKSDYDALAPLPPLEREQAHSARRKREEGAPARLPPACGEILQSLGGAR